MRQLLEQVVREMLNPYLERMEELSAEVEELRRRQQLMIRLGQVSQIGKGNKTIKVAHGDLTTPFIKWFSQSAGRVSSYRCPTVGEQALILNFGGGNTGAQSIALVGIDSSQFPFPSDKPAQVVTMYGDQCAQMWDMDEGTLTLKAAKKIILDTKLVQATKDVDAAGEVSDHTRSMQDDRDIYNGHQHPNSNPKTQAPEQKQ
ncbi:phage baseplate assembly protein V [Shewanella baltica]|uniref:phage baseplate assembly protein V n=1 Tax=Shewanella baltica TaxID=62322 RepID=UPI00217E267E|nr:phage baseplate assembly protein V [Shewanella baltica]MCS6237139.1 phage baseplate assembly protein V [Shewanella baltica]